MGYIAAHDVAARSSNAAQNLSVADVVVAQLHAWGVRYVWGVTGDAILHLADALAKHGGIRYIDMRHEEAAALAASAYAKATGQLGVCMATSGPGVAHLINGLADAKADRTPVLAITGQVERKHVGTDYKQYIDQQRLLAAVCDISAPIMDPAATIPVLLRAMRTAVASGVPTHVEVPKDLWPLTTAHAVVAHEPYLGTSAFSPTSVIRQAAEMLTQAQRPVLYIGRGASGAINQVMQLAERMQAPVVRTMGAAGFTPGFHHLVVGGAGEGGSEAAGTLLAEADLVLRIGATWWPGEWLAGAARVVAVDILPANVGAGIEPNFGVVGNAQAVLSEFLNLVWPASRPAWLARVHETKQAWENRIAEEAQVDAPVISPARLIRTLENVVPENSIIALDVGEHALWFNRMFRGRGQDVLISGMWRTMGFGLPAAAAAKLAYPHRPVVALVGDGGMGMVLGDFTSLVKHGLPVVIVVVNNGSLALEMHTMEHAGLRPAGAYLHNPDFAGVARLCGGRGYQVSSAADLEKTLRDSLWSDTPTLINVVTADTIIPTLPARSDGTQARPKA